MKPKPPSEKAVQRAIIEWLVWHGHLVIRVNQGALRKDDGSLYWFTRWQALGYPERKAGVADILGLTPEGAFFAIEVKAPGRKATAHQERFLQVVADRGGIALVADSVEKVEREFGKL